MVAGSLCIRNHSHRIRRENPNAYGTSVDVIIYTKMAWNGKRQFQSASESLLNNFEFVESALVCVQYPVENASSSCLTHCHRFSDY